MSNSDTFTQLGRESKFPSKKGIVGIYAIMIWLLTILILLKITKLASYDDTKYFFWIISILIPLLYLLYVKGSLQQLSKEEERKESFILTFSFISLVLTFFATILINRELKFLIYSFFPSRYGGKK